MSYFKDVRVGDSVATIYVEDYLPPFPRTCMIKNQGSSTIYFNGQPILGGHTVAQVVNSTDSNDKLLSDLADLIETYDKHREKKQYNNPYRYAPYGGFDDEDEEIEYEMLHDLLNGKDLDQVAKNYGYSRSFMESDEQFRRRIVKDIRGNTPPPIPGEEKKREPKDGDPIEWHAGHNVVDVKIGPANCIKYKYCRDCKVEVSETKTPSYKGPGFGLGF